MSQPQPVPVKGHAESGHPAASSSAAHAVMAPPAPASMHKCPVAHPFPVLLSCFLMAANAGFVNAFFLESIFATSVSHLTGTTTRAASQFAMGNYDIMFKNIGIVIFFFFGSALNSLIVGDSQMRLVQNYGFAIMLEALLLLLPVFIPTTTAFEMNLSIYIVAFACGLQNAMLTIYGTAVVRTTHVTGLITDVGILFGLYIRDLMVHKRVRQEGMWKIKIMAPLYMGFFTGGTLGMLSLQHLPGTLALVIPAVCTAWIGVGFIVLRFVHNKHEREKAEREAQRAQQNAEVDEELNLLTAGSSGQISRTNTTEEIEMQQGDDYFEDDDDHDYLTRRSVDKRT